MQYVHAVLSEACVGSDLLPSTLAAPVTPVMMAVGVADAGGDAAVGASMARRSTARKGMEKER